MDEFPSAFVIGGYLTYVSAFHTEFKVYGIGEMEVVWREADSDSTFRDVG